MSISSEDLERHKRHLLLKEIGGPGVQRLRSASVSIIGAGALGGPCALYLAAAGIGQIEIWDDDVVDRSNLQRQIQFNESQIGESKAQTLVERLSGLDSGIAIAPKTERFVPGSSPTGNILIDATDNYESRFALNRLAHETGRYLVSGAAARWSGQLSVYASGLEPKAPCYSCFVPEMPPEAEACDDVGVVGALTGEIGAAMALETVKLITGAGRPLIGRLRIYDGLSGDIRTLKLRPNTDCLICH